MVACSQSNFRGLEYNVTSRWSHDVTCRPHVFDVFQNMQKISFVNPFGFLPTVEFHQLQAFWDTLLLCSFAATSSRGVFWLRLSLASHLIIFSSSKSEHESPFKEACFFAERWLWGMIYLEWFQIAGSVATTTSLFLAICFTTKIAPVWQVKHKLRTQTMPSGSLNM